MKPRWTPRRVKERDERRDADSPSDVAADGVSPLCTVCDVRVDLGFYLAGFKEGRHRYCTTPEGVRCLAVCWECYYNPARVKEALARMPLEELTSRLLGTYQPKLEEGDA
jgi:hypothetical protein